MKRLRILEVTKSTAGVAEYVRWIIQGLDKTQFEFTVVCLSEGSEEFARSLTQSYGIKAYSLAMNRYKVDMLSDSKVALALSRILREEKFDLVHAHASKPGFLTRMAAFGLKTPIVYSPHCFSFHPGSGKLKALVLAFFERLAARLRTNRILVVAESEIKLAQTYHVGKPEQFVAINSGVDPVPFQVAIDHPSQKAQLGLKEGAFVVGSVGRLSDQKAPLDFIKAAGILAKKYANIDFVWVGSGPLLDQAQALCQTLGITSRMHFAGQRTDIPACLAVMDCFVLVSRWEGFPLVVLEAMAAGKPVVATDIDGTNDAIQNGIDGLLVPAGNPDAVAAAVEKVMLDHALAQRISQSGKQKVIDRFNRKNMLRGITQLYLDTAQGRVI
jgi:glycosyltransferase involved in cell wall biosynthesis